MADDALDTDPVERWRALNREHSRVLAALDRALESAHNVSACELDVLQRLAAQTDGNVGIQDLCESVQRSQSTMSRMVDRLKSQGLVTRTEDPNDRRRMTVELTDPGRERIAAAEITQRRVLAETLP